MIRPALGIMRAMLTLRKPWWAWLALLMALNMIAPLLFLGTPEARWTLAAMAGAFLIQVAIFSRLGFVRLLGIGHLLTWTPLLLWLVPRLATVDDATLFGRWLLGLVIVDGISLVIDLVDVIRYAAGDRTATTGP